MKNNALVLLWKGNAIPDYLIKEIAEILASKKVCMPELLTIVSKDDDAIASALIKDICAKGEETTISSTSTQDAINNAVIYIGERFKNSLSGTNGPIGNVAIFAIELSNAVATSRRNISFVGVGTNDELLTAIEILSTVNGKIPSNLAKKYHFTQNVVEVIKKIYNSY